MFLSACGNKSSDPLPVVTGVSISSTSYKGQTYVSLQASVTNASFVSGYCFKTSKTTPATTDTCFQSLSTSLVALPSTTTTYYVWAKDAAGHLSPVFTRNVAPFAIQSASVSYTSYGTVRFTASAPDSTIVAYCLTPTNTAPDSSDVCFQSKLSDDDHYPGDAPSTYYVWGKDNLGNLTNSASVGVCSVSGIRASTASSLPTVCVSTSLGEFVLELEASRAPITVANFLKYVNDGFYSDTIFHRVMATFMVQGGGFTSPTDKKTSIYDPIELEKTTTTGLSHVRGTVAMARTTDPNSATNEFFINVVDNAFLNGTSSTDGYAAFGRVISGLETTVEAIRKLPVHTSSGSTENSSPDTAPLIYWAYQLK